MLRSAGSRARGPLDSGCWILESVGGWVRVRRARGPLDSGCWILESVGGWVCVRRARGPLDSGSLDPGICGRLGVRAEGSGPLDSGSLDPGICGRLGWVCVRPPPGFWILDSGNWAVRRDDGGVGRPDSVFCILYSATGVWAARILYSAFCILPAIYMHVMHMHMSRDGT